MLKLLGITLGLKAETSFKTVRTWGAETGSVVKQFELESLAVNYDFSPAIASAKGRTLQAFTNIIGRSLPLRIYGASQWLTGQEPTVGRVSDDASMQMAVQYSYQNGKQEALLVIERAPSENGLVEMLSKINPDTGKPFYTIMPGGSLTKDGTEFLAITHFGIIKVAT